MVFKLRSVSKQQYKTEIIAKTIGSVLSRTLSNRNNSDIYAIRSYKELINEIFKRIAR